MGRRFLEQRVTSTFLVQVALFLWTEPSLRYFGRAKDLPGVRELFQGRKKEEEEENQALAFYKKFTQQSPAYFGDLDDTNELLLDYERKREAEGSQRQSRDRRFLTFP